jgi:hypothetical protein
MLLSFFSGTLLITILVTIGTILIPNENKLLTYFDWDEMILTLPVFRFVFMLIFALILISVDVYILRRFRVNYMFIFDLDPHYKVTHVQLFRVSMMLLTIWMLSFMAQVIVCKLNFLFEHPHAYATMALFIIFGLICFFPFHVFYMKSRKELVRVLFHIFVSPFGVVKFKHFFLADIITSLGVTLKDFISIFFLFSSGQWLDLAENAKALDKDYKPLPGEIIPEPYLKSKNL